MKTYKKILEKIANMETEGDYNEVYTLIKNAFDKDKISCKDYEILTTIADRVSVGVN